MESLGVVNYVTYVVGAILIVLLPGPNSLYVLSLSAQRGVRAGWLGAVGVFVGDSLLMLATAAGAVSLLQAYPFLFTAIKSAGALYLAYLGLRLIYTAIKHWPTSGWQSAVEEVIDHKIQKSKPFRRALLISLLNPKAILFFFSFFLQFIDPAYDRPIIPFLVLAISLQMISMTYLATLVYGGSRLAASFRQRHRLKSVSAGGAGALFIFFAIKLAMAGMLS